MPVMKRHALRGRHKETSKDELASKEGAARPSSGIEKLATAVILKIAPLRFRKAND